MSLLNVLSWTATAATVHWASVPVEPGAPVLLAVADMTNTTTIETRQESVSPEWTTAETMGVTRYGATITLPAHYAAAWFEIRAGAEDATPYTANVAEPWFLFGDGGSSSSPGGWVRVVGEAIAIKRNGGGAATLRLADGPLGAKSIEISARASTDGDGVGAKSTRWHAFFDLPATLAQGKYTASIANDNAAGTTRRYTPLCTFIDPSTPCLATLNVSAPFEWKTDVFTVNATQPGPGRDATAAVQTAIAAAAQNGGGVVYFPRGQYFVSQALVVAPGTVLRGEAAALVAVYFAEANATTAPDAYVTSSVAGPWGVEHLTFFVTAFANSIVRFQPGTENAFMRHCRIRFDSYFSLEPQQNSGSRGRKASWDHGVGTAVTLAGRNLFITDNDIYSSGDVVSTLHNGAAGAEYMHIARNRFWNGGTTHWGVSWKQCIYEDNRATGVSTTAMGSNYPQYAHNDGAPHVSNIAHFNNTQNMVWGNDREMMTCDGGGGVYYGGARAAAGSTRIALAAPATGKQPGGALCILAGRGTGECRRVVSSHVETSGSPEAPANNMSVFDITRPFSVSLDRTSMVTIMPYIGHIAFNGNAYTDGGPVQFYAQALGCVAAENTFERTGGLSTWARGDPGADANLRNSFIDNEVVEGNHVWNYATHPTVGEDPSSWPYFPGGSKTIEPWFFGSLTNDQGMGSGDTANISFKGGFNRFIVMRGNIVRNNGGIIVRGTSANVLLDSNLVELSDVGIHVNLTTTEGGVVLVNNTEPPNVPANYNPYQVGL